MQHRADIVAGVECVDHGASQSALVWSFQLQHSLHVAAPVLVIATVADNTDRVRLAEEFGKVDDVAVIVLILGDHLRLRAKAWQAERKAPSQSRDDRMRHVLLHSATFARIEPALKPFADEISPLIIDDAGDLSQPWGDCEAGSAIVFGNTDNFFSAGISKWLKTVMTHEKVDWFQSSAAGIEHPIFQSIGQKAELFTTCHVQSEAIAEWVLWAGLDFFQRGPARRAAQAAHEWNRLTWREISDTHWLVYGFGGIGEAVGKRLMALGARVTGVRRSGGTSPAANALIKPEEARALHGEADAILLCLPHTPETERMADADFFACMAPGSLFLNVGRGSLVDEPALLAALDKGRPAHAALDVLTEEPQPADGPFWDRPDVTLTAHISASTPQTRDRADAYFVANLARFLSDERLSNVVPRSSFA